MDGDVKLIFAMLSVCVILLSLVVLGLNMRISFLREEVMDLKRKVKGE